MPVCHGLHKSGIAHIPCPDKGQHLVFLLYKTLGLGQDDQVALVADRLEKAHRNGIRNTAVQQLIVADLHDLCSQRHGCRGLHPPDVLSVASAALVVDGLTSAHIGAHHKKVHGVLPEGLGIKGVQLFRHGMVAELLAVQVAGTQQIAKAGVALVITVFRVVADGAPDLVRLVVAAEHCPRRHANGTVQLDVMLHQHIQYASGEHSTHGAAFQHKSCFHTIFLLVRSKIPDITLLLLRIVYSKTAKEQGRINQK